MKRIFDFTRGLDPVEIAVIAATLAAIAIVIYAAMHGAVKL